MRNKYRPATNSKARLFAFSLILSAIDSNYHFREILYNLLSESCYQENGYIYGNATLSFQFTITVQTLQ